MSELSNLIQFSAHINLVFPGGALFLVCNDVEFKRLFMELTCDFLQGNHRIVNGVSVIGRNTTKDGDKVWMFSPSTQLDRDGNWVECNTSRFVWLPSANGLEGEKRLHCTICTPLDGGEALKDRALFGAHDTHLLNSQTTASYLFGALKRTTIPIAVDDINEKMTIFMYFFLKVYIDCQPSFLCWLRMWLIFPEMRFVCS